MKSLLALNQFFWKYRLRLIFGVLFIVLSNYFRILSPQFTAYVINSVVQQIEHKKEGTAHIKNPASDIIVRYVTQNLEQADFSEKILWSGIILLALAVISGIFMFLMRQTVIVMSRLIEYDQKNQVYSHYQKLDSHFFKSHNTGDLMNRISEDISRVRMYTGPALMYIINLLAVIGFSVYFMYQASPRLTLVSLLPLPVLAITIYFVNAIIEKKSGKIQALLSNLTTNAQESYSGIRVIKSYVQEKAMLGFFTKNSNEYKKNVLSLAKVEAIYFPSVGLLIGISTLITVMVGGLGVIHDPVHNKVGTIAEFVMYIQMLTFPVSAIGWTASMIQRAVASQKRINEFLNAEPLIKNAINSIKPSMEGTIIFNQINFTYQNTNQHAIKNFSLEIRKGQKVAVIGRTGSGKTTLAHLLLRIYEPNSGEILFDEAPMNKIDLEYLHTEMGCIPQDVFLFSDTIYNNIAFGLNDATEKQVVQAAKEACIHHDILRFEKGYQTLIGERGITLSGGQKQRISIARALIKQHKILVFDDCLSAVDAKTEKEILSNLDNYLQNKTAIIITHRIFSLFEFDNIVVLESGRIAEQGTHDTLMKQKGVYYDMYQLQQNQEENR